MARNTIDSVNAPRQLSGRGLSYWSDGHGDDRILYVTTGYRLVALAIEAGKTIILDREAVIEMADRYGVSIVAWREAQALRLAG